MGDIRRPDVRMCVDELLDVHDDLPGLDGSIGLDGPSLPDLPGR